MSPTTPDHGEVKREWEGVWFFLLDYNFMQHMMVFTLCGFTEEYSCQSRTTNNPTGLYVRTWGSQSNVLLVLRSISYVKKVTKVYPMIRKYRTRLKISNKNNIEDITSSCLMAKGEPSCFSFLTISSIVFAEKRLKEKCKLRNEWTASAFPFPMKC